MMLKSLIASQFVHILSPLQTDHHIIKYLREAFYRFLWDGKPVKIKRDILINGYDKGGLKMIDLSLFHIKSQKTY